MNKEEKFIRWVLSDLFKKTEIAKGENLNFYLPKGVYYRASMGYAFYYETIDRFYVIPNQEVFYDIEEKYVDTLYDLESDYTINPRTFKNEESVHDHLLRNVKVIGESVERKNVIRKILKENMPENSKHRIFKG